MLKRKIKSSAIAVTDAIEQLVELTNAALNCSLNKG